MPSLFWLVLRSLCGRVLDYFTIADHLLAKRDAPSKLELIEKTHQSNQVPLAYAVFAALSPDASRTRATQVAVRELQAAGVDVIVITRVTTQFEGANRVYLWTSFSRDYFAFRTLWEVYLSKVRKKQPILFLNDSIIWQSGALSTLLESIGSEKKVVIPTESMQVVRHAQPYFFFIPQVATNQQILSLFTPAREWRWKRTAVRKGEFVFLSAIDKSGLKFRFLINHQEMHNLMKNTCKKAWFLGCQSNPTQLLSEDLWTRYGFAKIKKQSQQPF